MLKRIKDWFCKKYPLYIGDVSKKQYVFSIEEKEDEQVGSYTDLIVTSDKSLAINVRCLPRKDRLALLKRVNEVLALGDMEYNIVK